MPERKTGSQREEREERDDYGRRILVTVTYADVSVPFRGDGSLFNVMPSTSSVIHEDIDVASGGLTYSLPLDEASAEKIDKLFARVAANLQQMTNDVENFSKTAPEYLSRLAAERKAKLDADAEKMKELGF